MCGAVLARDNVGASSRTNRLLDRLAIANSESSLTHVSVDVGENIDTAVVVDVSDGLDLAAPLHGHVLKAINHELEGAVGESGVGLLHILVVWHELVKNSLVGQLINLSRVGNLSLVHESRLIGERVTNVQEVGDDASIHHPCVDGSGHKRSGGRVNLAGLVRGVGTVLRGWVVNGVVAILRAIVIGVACWLNCIRAGYV